MGDCKELLFISDESGKLQCLNPHIGTTLLTYRGIASCKKNTLAMIGDECLIAADGEKRLLSVWPVNNAEPVTGARTVLPGKPNAIASSPDGAHLAVAIESKVYVYQINSGVLLGVLSKDYSEISKIVFLDDSVHFVTCSTVVNVWNLATALPWRNSAVNEITGSEPVYTFSHHSLPVSDAYVGPGGMKARLYTTSIDQTVKIYGLRDGNLLAQITFDASFSSLRPNCVETKLYLGSTSGKIFEYSLDPLPRTLDYEVQQEEKIVLDGHKKSVTCLATSIDGHTLISGSDDATVIVWHLPSRQLMSIFHLTGSVSGLILRPAFENAFTSGAVSIPFKQLHRSSTENDLEININTKQSISPITFETVVTYDTSDDVELLKEKIQQLVKKNKELYSFAMGRILGDAFGN